MGPISEQTGVKFYIIDESEVGHQLENDICNALTVCFPADKEIFSRCSWWHSKPSWRIIAFSGINNLVGHIAMIERQITVGDDVASFLIGGVQSVFVVPEKRGKGISAKLMELAMQHAKDRKLDCGILFCIPELEKCYAKSGWQKIDTQIYMLDNNNKKVPIPSKNIAMIYSINDFNFPLGSICLNGQDW
jgi:GNAT superfamily N-acetyltransferase